MYQIGEENGFCPYILDILTLFWFGYGFDRRVCARFTQVTTTNSQTTHKTLCFGDFALLIFGEQSGFVYFRLFGFWLLFQDGL